MTNPWPILPTLLTLLLTNRSAYSQRTEITFRNELPATVSLHWEGENKQKYEGDIPPSGGELRRQTDVGHRFSYEYGGNTHYVTVPPPSGEAGAFVVLVADRPGVRVRCTTTALGGQEKDRIVDIAVKPSWSPRGAARFLDLVRASYFDGCGLIRVVPRFLTQFGIASDPELRREWGAKRIPDDPPKVDPTVPFQPGYMSYAGNGPDSRTTQIFVVMPDAPQPTLDNFGVNPWETPFAVVENFNTSPVGQWHSYGDMPPWGMGPDHRKIHEEGYGYLEKNYPDLDYIQKCAIVDSEESTTRQEL